MNDNFFGKGFITQMVESRPEGSVGMSKLGWALLGGLASIGCAAGAAGGGELGKPIAQFPSRSDLESVASAAPPIAKPAEGLADAESWQTEAPPVAQAQYPAETSWDKLMVEAARGHGNSVALAPE